jgi:sugar phosphate isomerase/epimerase
MNIKAVSSHIGHLPSNKQSATYRGAIESVKTIADYCEKNNQQFRLETGMESAAVLRQFIIDVNRSNVKVNFDPANLIMNGYEGPTEALNQLGEYTAEVHLKDGKRPRPGTKGHECPIGQGDVDFTNLLRKLKTIGFKGVLTIEREISGENWAKDVLSGRKIIENIMNLQEIT